MPQPTTNSIQRAWLRRRRGRDAVVVGAAMCGGCWCLAAWCPRALALARLPRCGAGAQAADGHPSLCMYTALFYTTLFFLLKSFMKKKVAKKSRQTTSSISHVQHLLPRMLATWLGVGFGLGVGVGFG